jgi:hypothetical protein
MGALAEKVRRRLERPDPRFEGRDDAHEHVLIEPEDELLADEIVGLVDRIAALERALRGMLDPSLEMEGEWVSHSVTKMGLAEARAALAEGEK